MATSVFPPVAGRRCRRSGWARSRSRATCDLHLVPQISRGAHNRGVIARPGERRHRMFEGNVHLLLSAFVIAECPVRFIFSEIFSG